MAFKMMFRTVTVASAACLLAAVVSLSLPVANVSADLLDEAAFQFSQRKYRAATKSYRKAIKKDATQPHSYLGLSMALKARGDDVQAKAVLEQLLRLHPKFAAAHYNLGEIYEEQGDLGRAKASYGAFLKYSGGRMPNDPAVRLKFKKLGL